MEMIKKKETGIQRKEKIPICIIFLFLEILLCFLDNHSALFIADYYLLLVAFIGFMLLRNNLVVRLNPLMVSLFVIVISSLLFFNIMDRGTFLSYIIWMIVMILSLEHKFSNKELKLLMWGFILGSLIMSLLLLVQQHHYKIEGSFRFTIQILGNEEIDPNYLASFLYIGVVFSFYEFINSVGRLKMISLIIGLIESFAIFMTASRAAYIALILVFIGLFFDKSNSKNSTSKLLIFGAMAVLVIFATVYLSESVLNRFDFSSLMDESNRLRLEHWGAACLAFLKNPFIGYGASHTMTILSTYANHSSDAHNTIITLALHFGLIGSVPIFAIIIGTLKRFVKFKYTIMTLAFIGFVLINLIVANHLGISFWLPLLIFYHLSRKSEIKIAQYNSSCL